MNTPDETHEVPIILSNGERVAGEFSLWEEAPGNEGQVLLELRFSGKTYQAASEEGFFAALTEIRRQLDQERDLLDCYGSSRNVFPSPMQQSMGYGEKAYRLEQGTPAKLENLVSIFDVGPDTQPVTVAEQEEFYRDWLRSLK